MLAFLVAAFTHVALVVGAPIMDGKEHFTSATKAARAAASTTPASNTAALLQALQLAITEEDRLNILLPDTSDPTNILYQFSNNSVIAPTGGTIDLCTVEKFPALLGSNVAMALGFVNPCGLNTPHTHIRANEFLTVVQGQLTTGFIMENNPGSFGDVVGAGTDPKTLEGPLPQVTANLTLYKGIMYPMGMLHWQFNPTCEPAMFVAAFDNNDPGRMEAARAFFSIEPDNVIMTAMGDPKSLSPKNIDKFRQYVPSSYVEIITDCAVACGIPTGD